VQTITHNARAAFAITAFSLAIFGYGALGLSSPKASVSENEEIFGGSMTVGAAILDLSTNSASSGYSAPPVNKPTAGILTLEHSQPISIPPTIAGLSGTVNVKYNLLGDANLDGVVNGADFTILASNFGLGSSDWNDGNFLFSPTVNGSDFSALAANFGAGDNVASSVTSADIAALDAFVVANGLGTPAVPEPISGGAAILGLSLLGMRQRKINRATSRRA
jgi:hypothetical protein